MTNLHLTQVQRTMIDALDHRLMSPHFCTPLLQSFTVAELKMLREWVSSFTPPTFDHTEVDETAAGYVILDMNRSDGPDHAPVPFYEDRNRALSDAEKDARSSASDQMICALMPIKVAKVAITVELKDPEPFHG